MKSKKKNHSLLVGVISEVLGLLLVFGGAMLMTFTEKSIGWWGLLLLLGLVLLACGIVKTCPNAVKELLR